MAVVSGALAGLPAAAQEWSGSVDLAWAAQNVSGSEGSFRSQQNLDQGFSLEGLEVVLGGKSGERLRVEAAGFGQASPSEHARVEAELGRSWHLRLGYRSRDSFFSLNDPTFSERSDRWHRTQFSGEVSWDGWSVGRLTLGLDHIARGGRIWRPFYGLNQVYPGTVDLDESRDRAVLRFESRSWPVHLSVEQSYASYDRKNRWAPAGQSALDPDPDLLTELGTTYHDEQDVPTTLVTASWTGAQFAVAGQVLVSSADLDATGAGWESFDVDGGAVGSLRFVDELLGSATTDTLAGRLAATAALGGGWRLRLEGRYRDASSDAALLGQRLIRVTDPTGGAFDLSTPIDDTGRFDFTDAGGRAVLEHRGKRWSAWAGALVTSREVSWRRTTGDPGEDVDRDSTGWIAGAALHMAHGLRGSLEYEHGDFEEYVFRTDPETTDRVTLRLRARAGKGFSLALHARAESASPGGGAESALDRSASAVGAALAWSSTDGQTSAGVDLSLVSLTTRTGLVLPSGEPGLSRYDMALRSWSIYGGTVVGPVHLRGSVHRLDDTGDTWPAASWSFDLRAGVALPPGATVAPFVQYWSYDEDREDRDDYSATRYGVALSWSF